MIRLVLLCASCAWLLGATPPHPPAYRSAALDTLPLRFEENRGQAPETAPFIARGPDYQVEVAPTANVLRWSDSGSKKGTALRTRFLGANRAAKLEPEDLLPAVSNYFIGNSPGAWRTNIPNYARLRVRGIYPGIDLLFYGNGGRLEYDFVVNPGSDPNLIEFEIRGAKRVHVTREGDLAVSTAAGDARWNRPVVYQKSGQRREQIQGTYQVTGRRVRFRLGAYDHSRQLVIDPALSYATYFGSPQVFGIGFQNLGGMFVDAAGNVFIAGITGSSDLPVTAGVVQTAFGGYTANLRWIIGDAFIAKLTPAGAVSWVTYLGGAGDEGAGGLFVDSAGNIYVAGHTNSSDFPVTSGVFQRALKGAGGNSCASGGDAFVAKLNSSGSQLLYSTYLGGSLDDFATAITVDHQGNAYVTGATLSNDFPVMNAEQSALRGSGGEPGRPSCDGAPLFDAGDAFVAKLNPTATSLVFSTYLGGSRDDDALTIAIDASQNVYVGGFTLSSDFPVSKGALQTAFHGIDPQNIFLNLGDGFIAKLSSSGSTLLYSTYLGGRGDDMVTALKTDKSGTVYATGSTSSPDFPVTAGAVQRSYAGYYSLPHFQVEQNMGDAFVVRLDGQGATLLYSTYFGGSGNEAGIGIDVDPSGLIYLAGGTDSQDFPVTSDAVQSVFGGDDEYVTLTYAPKGDGFFAIIDPNFTKPVYSTYFGGEYDDTLGSVALDSSGNAWLAGYTQSPNLQVTSNAAQSSYEGGPASAVGPIDAALVGEVMLAKFSAMGLSGGPVLSNLENAASNNARVVSPGMVFVVYGTNLGPSTLVAGAADPVSGLLSVNRSGTAVLFDNIPSPLVYVSAKQVAGVVPYEVAGKMSSQVQVEVEGKRSAPVTVQVQSTAPGLFSEDFSGTGETVAYNVANGQATLNSASNPAPKGNGTAVEVFVTGEGETNPAGQDGLFSTTPPKPVAAVSVSVGGVPQTNILYAGGIPGEPPGVLQVNFVLDPSTPSGVQPIVVSVGGVSSQPGMTIAVQ